MNKTEQTTIIFTTHDMQDVEKVCERLIIIDLGKKIFDGSIEEIKQKYANSKSIEIQLEDGEKQIKMEPEIESIIRDIYERKVSLSTDKGKENQS